MISIKVHGKAILSIKIFVTNITIIDEMACEMNSFHMLLYIAFL